ncbi:MAG: 23S rRNA (pseudouridine(1915)-N(3))-methyltransferase RlmH [Gammaproteobacteria bacterium]
MRIHLLAVGTRMPVWVDAGFEEYARRMPRECGLILTGIPAVKKTGAQSQRRDEEGQRLLRAIPKNSKVIVLDGRGAAWTTDQLARHFRDWLQMGRDLSLLVGGADGLAPVCLERADDTWSLSALTFPHQLVRVIVAEQLYRAWSIVNNHPYHRGEPE